MLVTLSHDNEQATEHLHPLEGKARRLKISLLIIDQDLLGLLVSIRGR